MGDLVSAAAAILAQSAQRVELSGQNLANLTTFGYKRRIGFSEALNAAGDAKSGTAIDFSAGQLVQTGGAYDLAITGDGFFCVQGPDGPLYTRQGQFTRSSDGRLINSEGMPLLLAGGGELVLKSSKFQVLDDATVVDGDTPAGALAIVAISDLKTAAVAGSGLFTAPETALGVVANPSVRQGSLEASNVTSGDEMVAMMEALRRAGAAQRLVGVYDDLMGRAISAFGQQ